MTNRPEKARPRRFRTYPAYEDSGVDWLGEIPVHWKVNRLSSTVTGCQNGLWGEEADGMHDTICIRVADFDRVQFRVRLDDPTLRSIAPNLAEARRLGRGDLLLEKSGGGERQPVGAVVIYDHGEPAVCSNFVARMPVADGCHSRYLTYLHAALYTARINTRSIKQSTGIQNLDGASYLNETVGLPNGREQRAIAEFLDRETAKIDTLVAKIEQLIELLREKRAALITRAVTLGLDPNAPAKDSGVKWLGQIPAHWDVRRLKFLLQEPLQYGANEPAAFTDPEQPRYIRITDITEDGQLRDETFRSLPEEIAKPYLLQDGDLLFARSGATVGKTFRFESDWGRAAHAGYLIRARLKTPRCSSRFARYFTKSASYWDWLRSNFIQATIENVSADRYANLEIPVPELGEQEAIVSVLDSETARIDTLVARVQRAVGLLKEFRSSLISAAVTGKIDVRNEAA